MSRDRSRSAATPSHFIHAMEVPYSFRGGCSRMSRDRSLSAATPSHSLQKSSIHSEGIQQNVEMDLILLLHPLIIYRSLIFI